MCETMPVILSIQVSSTTSFGDAPPLYQWVPQLPRVTARPLDLEPRVRAHDVPLPVHLEVVRPALRAALRLERPHLRSGQGLAQEVQGPYRLATLGWPDSDSLVRIEPGSPTCGLTVALSGSPSPLGQSSGGV